MNKDTKKYKKGFYLHAYEAEKSNTIYFMEKAYEALSNEDWNSLIQSLTLAKRNAEDAAFYKLLVKKYEGPTEETGANKPIPDDQEHR